MNCQNCHCSSDIPCTSEIHLLQPQRDRSLCRTSGLMTTDRRLVSCPACLKLQDREGKPVFKKGGCCVD